MYTELLSLGVKIWKTKEVIWRVSSSPLPALVGCSELEATLYTYWSSYGDSNVAITGLKTGFGRVNEGTRYS